MCQLALPLPLHSCYITLLCKLAEPTKRKCKVLSISDKLDVCAMAHAKIPYLEICDKYGIVKSTITGILANESKLRDSKSPASGFSVANAQKTLKFSSFPELDSALFLWVSTMREKDIPVTGPMISEKAQSFYSRI